ncbi:hypothetical protein CYG49_00915 [Candidatus Saccharibacteria bacterium]|nr:MAG: hypothetical protein CYG49_00915 [Candidatus Saccharibacteria bacterium]
MKMTTPTVTDSREQERLLTEQALTVIAKHLLDLEPAQAVTLEEITHPSGAKSYKLLVKVDDDTADSYQQRLITPETVHFQDGAGATTTLSGEVVDAVVFWDEREETPEEAAWSLLGSNQDYFLQEIEYEEVNPDTTFGSLYFPIYFWSLELVGEHEMESSNGRPFDPSTLQFSPI